MQENAITVNKDHTEAVLAAIGSQRKTRKDIASQNTSHHDNWDLLQILTKAQYAKRWQFSLRKLDTMIQKKQLPVIRIGRSVRIRVRAADEALLKYELKAIS